MALMNLKISRTIQSFSENSTEAQMCNRVYDIAKKTVLSLFPWSFARYTAVLTVTEETSNKYDYVYEYPDDAIRIIGVSNSDEVGIRSDQFEIITLSTDSQYVRRIVCNIENSYADYIIDITEDSFSPAFCDALAWKISSMIGLSLGASGQDIQFAMQMFGIKLNDAQRIDMIEKNKDDKLIPGYIAARGGVRSGF